MKEHALCLSGWRFEAERPGSILHGWSGPWIVRKKWNFSFAFPLGERPTDGVLEAHHCPCSSYCFPSTPPLKCIVTGRTGSRCPIRTPSSRYIVVDNPSVQICSVMLAPTELMMGLGLVLRPLAVDMNVQCTATSSYRLQEPAAGSKRYRKSTLLKLLRSAQTKQVHPCRPQSRGRLYAETTTRKRPPGRRVQTAKGALRALPA